MPWCLEWVSWACLLFRSLFLFLLNMGRVGDLLLPFFFKSSGLWYYNQMNLKMIGSYGGKFHRVFQGGLWDQVSPPTPPFCQPSLRRRSGRRNCWWFMLTMNLLDVNVWSTLIFLVLKAPLNQVSVVSEVWPQMNCRTLKVRPWNQPSFNDFVHQLQSGLDGNWERLRPEALAFWCWAMSWTIDPLWKAR